MPPRRFGQGVWGEHGSNDEYNQQLTGREWTQCFKYMTYKKTFIFNVFWTFLSQFSPYITVILRGKIISILIDIDFDSPEEFLHEVNKYALILIFELVRHIIETSICILAESTNIGSYLCDLRINLTKSFLNHDISYYDQTHTGILLSRLTDDTNQVRKMYVVQLISISGSICAWISGFSVLLFYDWRAALAGLFAMVIHSGTNFWGRRAIDRLAYEHTERVGVASAKAEEILTSIRTVKSFDAELAEAKNYKEKLKLVQDTTISVAKIHGIKESLLLIIQYSVYSFLMWMTGQKVINKKIQAGDLSNILTLFNRWNFSFNGLFGSLMQFYQANVSAAKLLDIFNEVPRIEEPDFSVYSDSNSSQNNQPTNQEPENCLHLDPAIGKIEFKNVSFTYPSRKEKALDNLSFTVQPGETIAIVGESGCGKSTTLQILLRFYDADEGEVLIDGKNIRKVKPTEVRSQVIMVPQNPIIFSLSTRDNIRYGKPKASKGDVINASIVANAHSFIKQLSQGYRTKIQQSSLSGGQKQRICIARAVLMSAPILLLDEATAALDTESEKLVQDALQSYKKGRTVILVAHRLATVMNADKILVMNKGKIIEEGTHEQLLAQSGFYSHLVQHQLQ